MRIIAAIPARLGSSRFPNKPLFPILGIPMIAHVLKRAQLSKAVHDVIVATCDREIAQVVEKFGGKAVMTRPDHERGTDRIAEAVQSVEADIVVNVQGDEPVLHPEMIDTAVDALLKNPDWSSTNLISPIQSEIELRDVNQIKVVRDLSGNALYMSRQPIPGLYAGRTIGKATHWKQVCVIPFRRSTLEKFVNLPQTTLEKYESIDMMRLIENGIPVGLVPWTRSESQAVDIPSDVQKVELLLQADPIYKGIFK